MRSLAAAFAFLMVAHFSSSANASPCNDGFINPLTKISWGCIFPIEIAGVPIGKRGPLDADNPKSPVCLCPSSFGIPLPGLRVNFWNPSRWIDTVENPGCLMALGVDVMGETGRLHGTSRNDIHGNSHYTFAQMHYYIAPVWAILGLFQDLPCLSDKGFDVAMMSEILPTPQNEVFGNPAAILACVADAASANLGGTIDPLFWCMGGWGSVYPLGGSSNSGDLVEANAAIAAKCIFLMGRLGLLRLYDKSGCFETPAPIWKKSRFKLQEMEPVKSGQCVNIGRTGLLWSYLKQPPHKDNFAWAVFEKVFCCVRP
jgi:conjugal transfer pilus assembly protein TraU